MSKKKFKPVTFYISRGGVGQSDTYYLSSFPPRRDPNYDAYKASDGRVLTQKDMGSWMYWVKESESYYSECLPTSKRESLLQGRELETGQCINLSTGEVYDLSQAESYLECLHGRRRTDRPGYQATE